MNLRSLALHSPYNGVRPVIPQRPTHWTRTELDELRADLERRGRFGSEDRVAWIAMESTRERELERSTAYPTNTPPPARVLAETPLQWRASRRFFSDPQIPLLSHRIDQVINSILEATGRGTKAEGKRIFDAIHRWNLKVLGSAPANGARLPGGLYISVFEDQIKLSHLDQQGDAPATPGQLSRLRLLASLWRRLVTRVVAASLRLMVDAHPTADSKLTFALTNTSVSPGEAYVIEGLRPRVKRMQKLSLSGDYQLEARLATARVMTRYRMLLNQYKLAMSIIESFAVIQGPAVASLDPRPETICAEALDDVARRMIVPLKDGEKVGWDADADSYTVMRDTGFPYELATFTSLGTAIEVERANRYEGYGLRLVAA